MNKGRRQTVDELPVLDAGVLAARALLHSLRVEVALVVSILAVLEHLQRFGCSVCGELSHNARAADQRVQLLVGDPRLIAVSARRNVRKGCQVRIRGELTRTHTHAYTLITHTLFLK
jgi:hypothetical protein